MRVLGPTILAAGLALSAGQASAQNIGIGTMGQGTSGYSMGAAIAALLSEKTDINAIVQPSSGTSAYLPLLETGEVDFGIANVMETEAAMNGEEPFTRKLDNLRVVSILFPFRVGVFVRDDSDMQTAADLKGKRVTYGFTSQVTLNDAMNAILANGGLTPEDVEPVLVPNVVRGADDFASGNADAAFFAVGSGKVSEVDATVGGVRFLELSDAPEDVAALKQHVPAAYITTVQPAPNLAGVDEPLKTMAYDYVLLAGAHVPDEVVETVVRTLAENKDGLVASFASFKDFDPAAMAKKLDAQYHPGAKAYFEAQGMWPPKE